MVLQPKANLGGYPLILGRPWLATADAYIGCRSGNMTISHGNSTKELTLYPPAKPSPDLENSPWAEDSDEEPAQPLLTLDQASTFKQATEDDLICTCLAHPHIASHPTLEHILGEKFQEVYSPIEPTQILDELVPIEATLGNQSLAVEIHPGKTLNINAKLDSSQQKKLIEILRKHSSAFAWDYTDMKGIHPNLCTHHIYLKEDSRPIRQPQRRMNPALKDIVKGELQKLLDVNFIYPISDSKWVSPLVIVSKKNGKWRICVDYRELNKVTLKDYFPLPFIDQVLDTLAGKKYFSFLDGFSGYNQIQITPTDQEKTTFTCPWGTYAYRVLPFGLCNAPATFQRAVLGIFSDLTNDCVEIYMDDFIVYRDNFQEAVENLEKVLIRCQETNLSLSH
jgi:hypothetical protein